MEGFLSDGSSQVFPAGLTPSNAVVAAMSSPPPIELKKAENPLEEASPPPIPSPRKSSVVGLWPNRVKGLIINSLKLEDPPDGSPSPSPDVNELLSSFTPLLFACVNGVEDVIESMVVEALSRGSDGADAPNHRP